MGSLREEIVWFTLRNFLTTESVLFFESSQNIAFEFNEKVVSLRSSKING